MLKICPPRGYHHVNGKKNIKGAMRKGGTIFKKQEIHVEKKN
jgi:hypothetical protein